MSCYRIVRKQFPFIVAEALTNHKSQGDTYECVVVHIEQRLPRNALTLHLVELRLLVVYLLLEILN